jgi:hypothetical protein
MRKENYIAGNVNQNNIWLEQSFTVLFKSALPSCIYSKSCFGVFYKTIVFKDNFLDPTKADLRSPNE